MIGPILAAAIRFRTLLVGVAAALIVLGALSLRSMPVDVLPELAPAPVLEVQTEAPGLSSTEVENYLTVPMENNLLDGVMGVWDVRSQSVPGLSTIDLYFEPGVTVLHARQLVEERLTNSFSLPNVAKPPLLIQPLSSTDRVLMIGLSSTTVPPLELSYLARWVVKPKLTAVQGVANIAIFGQQDRQIQVRVHPSELARRGITLQQVINTSGNAQLVSPLSYLPGSAPGTGGFLDGPNQRLDVRPVLPLAAPADLAAVPISGTPGKVKIGQIANVVLGHQPLIGSAITNQGAGLVLLVQKLPSASVRGVTDGVMRALVQLAPALKGVHIDTNFFKPAGYVTKAMHNVEVLLLIAGILGALALLLLLVDLRALAIGLLSVALSLLAAAVALNEMGYTINALVVLGLLLASAVIVDDAVGATRQVMSAAVTTPGDNGSGPVPVTTAILRSYGQMRGTLAYATLIVLLTVAPLYFAKGLTATYLHPMALAFALGVIASMVIALTITPALGALLFARGKAHRTDGPAEALAAFWDRIVRLGLALPKFALLPVCALGLVGLVVLPFLNQPAPPRFQDRDLVVDWHGPTGISLTEMDRITGLTVNDLRTLPSVADVSATIGRAVAADQIVGTGTGQIYVALRPSANYDRAVNAVRSIVGSVPGMSGSVSTYESLVQAGVLQPGANQVTVRVYGEDYPELDQLANEVRGLMSHVYGLGPGQIQTDEVQPAIQVAINDTAAHNAGVEPGDARRQASTLVNGLTVGNFFEDQAVFDVVVLADAASRASLDAVRALPIDTSNGNTVPLSKIASVYVDSNPIDIEHEALSRYVDVTAPIYAGSLGAAQASLRKLIPAISYPLGYHSELVYGTPYAPTAHLKFISFAGAALVGVFLLLQAALDAWLLSLLVLLALPAALSGGLIVAFATNQAQTLGADAGLIAIFALVARQALLQAVAIRKLANEHEGELTTELVLTATRDRRAASLGGTLTLAAVMVPFVVSGDRPGNEITHVTAAVILGGLLSATLISELFIPAICRHYSPRRPLGGDEEQPLDEQLVTPPVPVLSQ